MQVAAYLLCPGSGDPLSFCVCVCFIILFRFVLPLLCASHVPRTNCAYVSRTSFPCLDDFIVFFSVCACVCLCLSLLYLYLLPFLYLRCRILFLLFVHSFRSLVSSRPSTATTPLPRSLLLWPSLFTPVRRSTILAQNQTKFATRQRPTHAMRTPVNRKRSACTSVPALWPVCFDLLCPSDRSPTPLYPHPCHRVHRVARSSGIHAWQQNADPVT